MNDGWVKVVEICHQGEEMKGKMILEQELVHRRSIGVGDYIAAAFQEMTMLCTIDVVPQDEQWKSVAATTIVCFLQHFPWHADHTSWGNHPIVPIQQNLE